MKSGSARVRRLIIVSNRLPFSVAAAGEGFEYRETTGGLVTGLGSYLSTVGSDPAAPAEYVWVGWPGATVEPERRQRLREHVWKEYRSVPVFLSEAEMDRFYLGFCNKTIWPLFHSFPSYATYEEATWETYKAVNEEFCDTLVDSVGPDDLVWIHDYHLLLLPHLLKAKKPGLHIGFFLHIPFPSYEIFRLLPSGWRKDLLEGILGADLVGFHTHEYTQHFLQSVLRILGHSNSIGQILLPDRVVSAATFPMGIDYARFSSAASSPEVQAEVSRLRTSLGDVRIVLSADRLDYTKGILNRLQAYDLFLHQNPQWLGKVVLVLVVVPSRIGVDQYDMMKRQLEEQVGRINGKHGRIGWTPVVYQYRHVPFVPLVALYAVSDAALVVPLRDGMNLVAKEYLAARPGGTGVLILSEMAGAAKELGEAILVNPNHCGEIAASIGTALDLPLEEQSRRVHIMQGRLRRYTVHRWAFEFVQATLAAVESRKRFDTQVLSGEVRKALLDEYRSSSKRLILLDYDGTLVHFVRDHSAAEPGREVLALVKRLVADPTNHCVIVSGRDRRTLEGWFATIPIHLVAEHGFLSRRPGDSWRTMKMVPPEWKRPLLPILHLFADRLPGATVEEKEYSVVWHYRGADPGMGEPFVHELADNLNSLTGNVDVQVVQGNRALEVRVAGIDKGTIARELMAEDEYDFILAIGDDRTDEDLFEVLPEWAHSVKVGGSHSHARYTCRDVDDVHRLLSMLAILPYEKGAQGGPVVRVLRFLERVTKRMAMK